MDVGGIEQAPVDAMDSEIEQAPVSMSEVSHGAYGPQGKLYNNQDIQEKISQVKDSQAERTPKANASTLPAPAPPVSSGNSPTRSIVQRSNSASASFHRSRQNLPTGSSTTVSRPTQDAPPSAEAAAPSINVTPSSPLTRSSASRPVDPIETLASVAESPARNAQNAAGDRRASRRRSGVDGTNNHRLSGFFSNLLHLRERDELPASSSRNTRHSTPARPSSPSSRGHVHGISRPPAEPLPPALPSPTLRELGLSLSVLTGDLPANQFVTPTNGTFLSPHYLLLCHSQGLDVMPLMSPPSIQPYALVRRVAFKSVVVMEERGVLVAIAGRRDGVRVYALEEIKKAVEWRIDVELRRELEKQRREEMKRVPIVTVSPVEKSKVSKRKSVSIDSLASSANTGKVTSRKRSKSNAAPPLPPLPSMPPPSFPPQRLVPRTSVANFHIHRAAANSRARAMSIAEAMGAQNQAEQDTSQRNDDKGEWMDGQHSDDEILIAAGPSGSAALDERTSAISAAQAHTQQASDTAGLPAAGIQANVPPTGTPRRRPANLDLSRANDFGNRPPLASPAPTLMSIRHALNQLPNAAETRTSDPELDNEPATPNGEVISFVEALLESRLPEAPPIGDAAAPRPAPAAVVTRFPLTARSPSSHGFGGTGLSSNSSRMLQGNTESTRGVAGLVEGELSDQETEADHATTRAPSRLGGGSLRTTNRRHRWSVLDGVFRSSGSNREATQTSNDTVEELPRSGTPLARTLSDVSIQGSRTSRQGHRAAMSQPSDINAVRRSSSGLSKFFSKKNKRRDRSSSNAANSSMDHLPAPLHIIPGGYEKLTGMMSSPLPPQAPPPKLEYVKLPGTKGSLMIKAVETAKKSFLAILCGDNGEKVELFAGTYRTALGLSRTFILPDSPKTLELQLQGDDLVEVFLVFSQNVFALEPATVRVREVRIGRAERRAARRRANRGANRQPTEDNAPEAQIGEEDVAITAMVAGSEAGHDDVHLFPNAAPRNDSRRPSVQTPRDGNSTPIATSSLPPSASSPHFPPDSAGLPPLGPPTTPHPEELATAALIAMGPYTTFQQLSFAPPFPLATLAEECMIPPTYKSVLQYKQTFEADDDPHPPPDVEATSEVSTPSHDVQWYYKDPRGIVRGPWPSSLMQSWFKDDFLPPDLPVRRDSEAEYTPLRELQRQSIDPSSPFRPPPPGLTIPSLIHDSTRPDGVNPLLEPISLLTQEKRWGPPALFYSSRGGHSTSIVDSRGRSVLKGRFYWTSDDATPHTIFSPGRLGDVKRLEAFEVAGNRAIVVAFRQGGLEAAEIGDAIMTPGDECRTVYPYFDPPLGSYNRRSPYVWRTGDSVNPEGVPASPMFPSDANITTTTVAPSSTFSKRRSMNTHILSNNRGSAGKPSLLSDGEEDGNFFGAQEELLIIGRSRDKVYFCDRSPGHFRMMVLSTNTASIS